ncbi:MAG: ABC transporter permease, partial [Candidatus Bathyarchaeia archaeon]
MLARVESVINQTFLIFAAFLYFTILIGILGIAIIMTMSVLERRREIGILMSLGMSRSKILCLFLIEAVLVSFIGFLVALPCGIVLLKGTSTTMTLAGLRFPFVVPWFAIGQSLIFALAAAMLGAAYPAYKASRLSVVEALRWR